MSQIRSMSDRLANTDAGVSFWRGALGFLPGLGLSKVVFYNLSDASVPQVRSNAGAAWTDAYTKSVVSGEDPFARNCLSRIAPTLTGVAHLEAHPYLDAEARDMVAQGSETLGIRSGMSVTISPDAAGAGIGWNLMTRDSAAQFAERRATFEAEWRAWCQLTFAGLSAAQPCIDPSLSVREHDCLAFVADGLRTADIAYRLGIAEATVEKHLRNARERLGAKTRDQAVAIAVRKGLV